MKKSSFRFFRFPCVFFLAVWVILTQAAPLWAGTYIYDNSVHELSVRFDTETYEVGDEILLAGTERYLTYCEFGYWGTNTASPANVAFAGTVEARLRFYLNDGPLWNGYPTPGPRPFFDSGWFGGFGPTGRSTFIFTAGSDFPSGGLLIPADSMTWSVQFRGMGPTDTVGVDLYSPPTVGQNYEDYWQTDGTGWILLTNAVPMDFRARMYANAGQTVNPTPPWLTNVVSGSNLILSWASDHIGWKLQLQTNAPHLGISTNWYTVSSSGTTNLWTLPIDQARGSVFCRLIYP